MRFGSNGGTSENAAMIVHSGNAGNTTFNGNVGIGTTAPAQKLDVRGTTVLSGNTTVLGTSVLSGNTAVTGTLAVTSTSLAVPIIEAERA